MKKRAKFYFPNKTLSRPLSWILTFVFFSIGFYSVFAQNNQDVLDYAGEKMLMNPEESILIAERFIQKTDLSDVEKCRVHAVFAKAYMLTQDYDKTIKHLFEIFENDCVLNEEEWLELMLMQNHIYQKIQLKLHSEEVEDQINKFIGKVENPELQEKLKIKSDIYKAFQQFKDSPWDTKLSNEIQLSDNQEEMIKSNQFLYSQYLVLKHFNSTDRDIESILNQELSLNDEDFQNFYERYYALIDARKIFISGEMDSAQNVLFSTVQSIEKQNGFSEYKEKIFRFLVEIALQNKDKIEVASFRDKQQTFSEENDQILTNAVAEVFSQKNKENIREQNALRSKYNFSLKVIWVVGTIVFIVLLTYFLRLIWLEKHYKEIAAYIEEMNSNKHNLDKNSVEQIMVEDNGNKHKLKISTDAEQQIISGLKEFEEREEFLQNDISLAYLASSLKMNTKYLSEVLNSKLNENFNGYINRLRIEYVVNKLKNNPEFLKYKISYLAELAGYTSHSSFTTAFKSVTGVTPTTFIGYLKRKV